MELVWVRDFLGGLVRHGIGHCIKIINRNFIEERFSGGFCSECQRHRTAGGARSSSCCLHVNNFTFSADGRADRSYRPGSTTLFFDPAALILDLWTSKSIPLPSETFLSALSFDILWEFLSKTLFCLQTGCSALLSEHCRLFERHPHMIALNFRLGIV